MCIVALLVIAKKMESPKILHIYIIYLFIFGCAGSLLRCGLFCNCDGWVYSLVAVGRHSLQWLLLLQSTGSRAHGL